MADVLIALVLLAMLLAAIGYFWWEEQPDEPEWLGRWREQEAAEKLIEDNRAALQRRYPT